MKHIALNIVLILATSLAACGEVAKQDSSGEEGKPLKTSSSIDCRKCEKCEVLIEGNMIEKYESCDPDGIEATREICKEMAALQNAKCKCECKDV